jgi:hypothetical protein
MILATIKAGFEFGTEALRFLQTEQGKDLVERSLKDRAAMDKFWADVAAGAKAVIKGDIFK